MKGIFEFIINGEIKTFNNYNEIPNKFDHIIKFKPDIPDGPHSHEQHEELNKWHEKLKELLKRETNGN